MYWIRRRLYSQNFLVDRKLIQKLIRASSIVPTDTVLDIGSGHGLITHELLKITPHVIAIEKDLRFTKHPQDFLTYSLPPYPYKVFANIPFSITGEIIRKLLNATNPPLDCYLIIQTEAAQKFIINPKANTMTALLYHPWWEIRISHRFNRSDFYPPPKVESDLIHIKPRTVPLVPITQKTAYSDLIAYSFIHNPQAKFIPPSQWLQLKYYSKYKGAYSKLLKEQISLQKIHRTRTDKNWKKYKAYPDKI